VIACERECSVSFIPAFLRTVFGTTEPVGEHFAVDRALFECGRQLLCVVAFFTSLPILICPKIFATVRTYPAPAVLIVKLFLANLAWLERQRILLAIPFIERRPLGFALALQLYRTIASAIFLVTRFEKYLAAFALRLFRRRLLRIVAREHLRLDMFVFFRRPRRSAGALLGSAYRISAFAIP
jgi:hypothetical protein